MTTPRAGTFTCLLYTSRCVYETGREVARIALEKLIVDGRIHPARIEEMVEKAQKEVETMIREEGEAATLEVGVHGIHPELVRLLGKMKYRTSYGQNALKHSIEVAHLSGLLAGELGADVRMAKRACLLYTSAQSHCNDRRSIDPTYCQGCGPQRNTGCPHDCHVELGAAGRGI